MFDKSNRPKQIINPAGFNPAAALLLDEASFTLKVNRRTGAMRMETNSPETNFLAVMDLFATQIQAICRQALAEQVAGNPAFVPPGRTESPGGTSGGDGEQAG